VQSDIRASAASTASGALCFSSVRRHPIACLPALQPDVVRPLYFFIISIVLRIVFPLIPIVLAPAAFLSSAQGLALQTASIFHCRSPVFFPGPGGTGCDRNSFRGVSAESTAPTGTSVILALFCAGPKKGCIDFGIASYGRIVPVDGTSLPRRSARPRRSRRPIELSMVARMRSSTSLLRPANTRLWTNDDEARQCGSHMGWASAIAGRGDAEALAGAAFSAS
jgi:hypothetical protein